MGEAAAAEAVERQLVVFKLGDEDYGIDIGSVREIITVQRITRVPRAPDFIEGIINLRGNVIPVIDLRKRFELPVVEHTRDTRIVVVEIGEHTLGVVVDAVSEVLRIPSDSIEPPSSIVVDVDSQFIEGIARLEERLIILLNMDRLLDKREVDELAEVEEA
ncbi:MAG TPA: chemotaxis protein CheW [Firmicutes bacterium]|nr:chemotaxis protein CheW [Bacillota bacterium]